MERKHLSKMEKLEASLLKHWTFQNFPETSSRTNQALPLNGVIPNAEVRFRYPAAT